MSEEVYTPAATVTDGGFSVSATGGETEEQIKENFASIAKPKDGEEPDPEREERDRVSKAASELGKQGGKARAQGSKPDVVAESKPEKTNAPTDGEDGKRKGDPRHDPQARINEISRKAGQAERERDAEKTARAAAEAKAAALEARLAAQTQPGQVEQPKPQNQARDSRKPSLEAFRAAGKSDEDFIEAVADWKAEEKTQQWQARMDAQRQAQEYWGKVDAKLGKAVQAFNDAAKEDPELDSKLSDDVKRIIPMLSITLPQDRVMQLLTPDHVIADELVEAADPKLAVYLSQNPDELQRLRALPTHTDVKVEMRILARSLGSAANTGTAPKAAVSKAKPPVSPVTGSPHRAVSDEPSEDDSFEAHVKKANAREFTSRRAGGRRL